MTDKMMDRINNMIKNAVAHYDSNGHKWDDTHKLNMAEIKGAVEMLKIATGKNYFITDQGLVEDKKFH